jgi:hypothetical protein
MVAVAGSDVGKAEVATALGIVVGAAACKLVVTADGERVGASACDDGEGGLAGAQLLMSAASINPIATCKIGAFIDMFPS